MLLNLFKLRRTFEWSTLHARILVLGLTHVLLQDETKNGRMCLPPMLLHTIKNTKEEKYYDIFHMAVPV